MSRYISYKNAHCYVSLPECMASRAALKKTDLNLHVFPVQVVFWQDSMDMTCCVCFFWFPSNPKNPQGPSNGRVNEPV